MSPYQFTADDADIILRASRCEVPRKFRVHKVILSIASPVFKDMFAIPQPIPEARFARDTIPVIDVDDTPEDLEDFLRMIYPFGFPAVLTLDEISRAIAIFDKYQVQGESLSPLRSLLVSPEFLKNEPIRVYSLACGWGFKREADLAAPYTSFHDVLASARVEDVQQMTGMEYRRILILSRERQAKSRGYILATSVPCVGCPNHKKFYAAFRERLLEDFTVDHRQFYDSKRCIVRCFEIAMRMDGTGDMAAGMAGCVGKFIRTLAKKLSSPW
jgi:hypothetical protein